MPKRFRLYFRFNRELLRKLPVLAWQAVLQVYRAVLDRDDVTPGMIVCIHTFGELAHWHPHIHALVSDGAFDRDGTFVRVPEIAIEPFLKLWEKALFDLLLSEGRITEQIVEQMRSQVCLSSDPGAASLVNPGPPPLPGRPGFARFQVAFQTLSQYLPGVPQSGFLSASHPVLVASGECRLSNARGGFCVE